MSLHLCPSAPPLAGPQSLLGGWHSDSISLKGQLNGFKDLQEGSEGQLEGSESQPKMSEAQPKV